MTEVDTVIGTGTQIQLADGKICTIRRLTVKDVFAIARLALSVMQDIGLEEITESKDDNKLAMDILIHIIQRGDQAFYQLLADILETDVETAKQLGLPDAMKMINTIIAQEDIEQTFLEAKVFAETVKTKWGLDITSFVSSTSSPASTAGQTSRS